MELNHTIASSHPKHISFECDNPWWQRGPFKKMGIRHQDAPALRAAGDDTKSCLQGQSVSLSTTLLSSASFATWLVQTSARPLVSGEVPSARGVLRYYQLRQQFQSSHQCLRGRLLLPCGVKHPFILIPCGSPPQQVADDTG